MDQAGDSGYHPELHISERQKNRLIQKNLKIHKEKVFKEEIIDLERAQFERKINKEAQSLMKLLKLPVLPQGVNQCRSLPSSPLLSRKTLLGNNHESLNPPRSSTPRRGSMNYLEQTTNKHINKAIETIVSPPSPTSSPLQIRKNLANDQQGLNALNSPRRRGSMNDISPVSTDPHHAGLDMLISLSSTPRRGSMGDVSRSPSPLSLPSSGSLLQRRRNTIAPLSPLCDKPLSLVTRHLVKRELVRRNSSISSESPPESPRMGSLEEQFKSLESCRYLRRRESQDDEEDIDTVFNTKQTS